MRVQINFGDDFCGKVGCDICYSSAAEAAAKQKVQEKARRKVAAAKEKVRRARKLVLAKRREAYRVKALAQKKAAGEKQKIIEGLEKLRTFRRDLIKGAIAEAKGRPTYKPITVEDILKRPKPPKAIPLEVAGISLVELVVEEVKVYKEA